MPREPHFTPELFRFLRQLGQNNNREWFEKNKSRYLEDVREPMLQFIADFGPRLAKISSHVHADPRPQGGSMFRIYRDVRFSKDKSPYKTYAAARFLHENAKQAASPAFYFSLSADGAHAAAGVWHPDGAATATLRNAIVERAADWKRIHAAKAFKTPGGLQAGGDSLKRPPRGFDPSHPFIDDLKRKDFYVWTDLGEKAACAPGFLGEYVKFCRSASPYTRFLADALGQPF
jgi:uncharacterized protein (TIGR02453 family)